MHFAWKFSTQDTSLSSCDTPFKLTSFVFKLADGASHAVLRCNIQWNPVNTDTKGTCHSVRIIRVSVLSGLSEKTSGTQCFIDINTKADSFTNQGSVEVCGKAVNRGGGLGMEIPCVYIFDDPRKHAWIYLNNS